jgi:hypothetical protein
MQRPGRYKHHGSFRTCPVLDLPRGDAILLERESRDIVHGFRRALLRQLRWASCREDATAAIATPIGE